MRRCDKQLTEARVEKGALAAAPSDAEAAARGSADEAAAACERLGACEARLDVASRRGHRARPPRGDRGVADSLPPRGGGAEAERGRS